jgi:thioredoxin-like negative regulator of GroEL
MGLPQKRASKRKSRLLSFPVNKAQLKAYQQAASVGFKGDVADFLRAAADDLAARLAATETQLKRERSAFLRAAADALVAHLEREKRPSQHEP